MILRRQLSRVVVVILALAGIGIARSGKPEPTMPMNKAFLAKVSQINLAEVELGNLAQQKGKSEAVREFGRLMVNDHRHAEMALKPLAARLHLRLAATPGKDVADLQEHLAHLSPAQFDQDYIRHMVAGHNGAITMIEHEIENGREPTTRAFAEKILPTVQDHLRIAENIAGRMGMSGNVGLSQLGKAIPIINASKWVGH